MALSDETSRSESSASLGGGGGGRSLSGAAVKAGDFLEKSVSCNFGAGRHPDKAGTPTTPGLIPWQVSSISGRAEGPQGKGGRRARDGGGG